MIQHLAAAALLLVQAAPEVAPPTPAPCITHQEAADVAISLLPFVLDAVAQRCRQTLPPTAFLNTGAAAWSSRLRQDGTARQESAMRGIAKMGGAAPPPNAEVGQAAFVMVAQMMTGSLTTQLRTEQCPQIDTIARSLEPLPTENIANLIIAGLDLGMSARPDTDEAHPAQADADHDEHESSGPPICRS